MGKKSCSICDTEVDTLYSCDCGQENLCDLCLTKTLISENTACPKCDEKFQGFGHMREEINFYEEEMGNG